MGDARLLFTSPAVASAYARVRPSYPQHVFERIAEYADAHGAGRERALDVATGTGQAAGGLARVYSAVVGVDASPAQVAAAVPPAPNVTFAVGTAEALAQPDASADCVCVAEALHWFDRPAFWREAARVLRPGGVVAVLGYAAVRFPGAPAADEMYNALFDGTLGPYWHPNKRLVDDLYRGCEPPAPPFADVQRLDGLTIEREWSVDDALGYAHSWSGLATFLAAHGVARGGLGDPVAELEPRLRAAVGPGEGGAPPTFRAVWPLTLILARKPREGEGEQGGA